MKKIERQGPLTLVVHDPKLSKLLTSLQEEPDRSVAIIVGTVIEERLAQIILYFLGDSSNSKEFIKNNLRGLYARIKAAYCLGLISEKEYEALEFIRDVRNDFAHSFVSEDFDGTFESKKNIVFSALGRIIPNYNPKRVPTARKAFTEVSGILLFNLWERESELKPLERTLALGQYDWSHKPVKG
jgi:hypothetical protein